MARKTFYKRVLVPAGIVLFLMILSINIYNISPVLGINHPGLGWMISNVSALFMFVSIWFGAFIAHPLAYRAGASMKERVLVGLVTPLVWSAKMESYWRSNPVKNVRNNLSFLRELAYDKLTQKS